MRMVLFLLLTFGAYCATPVIVSQPKGVYTSSALFTSLSNSGLTTHFLTCPNTTRYKVWSVTLTFTTTGKVDVCKSSGVLGTCSTAGDTTSTPAIDLDSGDTVILGFNQGSYKPSEVTTFTKLDGTFTAYRECVAKEYYE